MPIRKNAPPHHIAHFFGIRALAHIVPKIFVLLFYELKSFETLLTSCSCDLHSTRQHYNQK